MNIIWRWSSPACAISAIDGILHHLSTRPGVTVIGFPVQASRESRLFSSFILDQFLRMHVGIVRPSNCMAHS
jgi:hypothetical protein